MGLLGHGKCCDLIISLESVNSRSETFLLSLGNLFHLFVPINHCLSLSMEYM